MQVAAAIAHRFLSNTTLAFSSVVGPVEEVSFYGHPLAFIAPSVYGHPHVSNPFDQFFFFFFVNWLRLGVQLEASKLLRQLKYQ